MVSDVSRRRPLPAQRLALAFVQPAFDQTGTGHLQPLEQLGRPDDKVVELFRRGYLRAIYFMIASLKQIPVLAQKKNARLAA